MLPLTSKSGSNSATQISSSQNEVQEGVKDQVVVQDPEAGPGTATQTYREEQTNIQSNINQKKYVLENYFQSIYEVEDRIIEKEPPTKNVEFLERRPDPNRQHQNLNSMTVWEGVIPSIKNLAYIFNKRQDNSIKYADAPYMPQIIDLA